jgi:hypothetical protein
MHTRHTLRFAFELSSAVLLSFLPYRPSDQIWIIGLPLPVYTVEYGLFYVSPLSVLFLLANTLVWFAVARVVTNWCLTRLED